MKDSGPPSLGRDGRAAHGDICRNSQTLAARIGAGFAQVDVGASEKHNAPLLGVAFLSKGAFIFGRRLCPGSPMRLRTVMGKIQGCSSAAPLRKKASLASFH